MAFPRLQRSFTGRIWQGRTHVRRVLGGRAGGAATPRGGADSPDVGVRTGYGPTEPLFFVHVAGLIRLRERGWFPGAGVAVDRNALGPSTVWVLFQLVAHRRAGLAHTTICPFIPLFFL